MSSAFPPPPPPPEPFQPPGQFGSHIPPVQPGMLGAISPHRGSTVLTLGIISLTVNLLSMVGGVVAAPCCFGTLIPIGLAIPAWVMANTDLRLMSEGRMDTAGLSSTSAGRICAIISIALSAIGLLLAILAIAFGAALFGIAAAASGSRP